MSLQAIKFTAVPPSLSILNQLLVPYQSKYLNIDSIAPLDTDNAVVKLSGYDSIKGMYTRGAPAIMLVGCFSIVIELDRVLHRSEADVFKYDVDSIDKFKTRLLQRIDYLISSRPTAVNLANGCNSIKEIIKLHSFTLESLYQSILKFSQTLYTEDLQSNLDIGFHGLQYVIDTLTEENFNGPFSVMTICNTGSLATSGHGTALGIIRHLDKYLSKLSTKSKFFMDQVYACETRPYNQGSRLTAYELDYEKIPFTLVTDNMASFLIDTLNCPEKHKDQHILQTLPSQAPLKFIIVGADRIVRNGDLANKIGTFQLSLIASQYKGVKFIGAAPTTTIDELTDVGSKIVIEERAKDELTMILGAQVKDDKFVIDDKTGDVSLTRVKLAPLGIHVWNPSFDVTPHENIDCIVTEKNYILKDNNGEFHL